MTMSPGLKILSFTPCLRGQPVIKRGVQHHRPMETGINVFLPERSISRARLGIQERIDATIQMATAARAVASGDRENGYVRSVF